jgi:hypothetical protein
MIRRLSFCVSVLCGLTPLVLALGAQQPAAAPGAQAPPNAQGAPRAPYKPRNLKVLPQDTNLRVVMDQYNVALGVRCEFCHAAPDPVTHRSDRASDANPTKDVARLMIQMTGDLNTKYLAQLPDRHDTDPLTCGTCHRGEKHPPAFAPAPQPDANRPPAPPPSGPSAN